MENLIFVIIAGFRFAPVISTVDEEVESQHLRFLAVPPGTTVFDLLKQVVPESWFVEICMSVHCTCMSMSVHLPVFLSVCLSVRLSVCASVCLSVFLFGQNAIH